MSVELAIAAGVAHVVVNDAGTRNALSVELVRELMEVCAEVDANTAVGALVLSGANGTFCSGADRRLLARAAQDPAEGERHDAISHVYRAFTAVGALSVPTIAAVRGVV
jgi:enoyl-CoA hydratase